MGCVWIKKIEFNSEYDNVTLNKITTIIEKIIMEKKKH